MIWTKEETIAYLQEQEEWMFEVKKKRIKTIRSLAQNRYYFWIVVETIWDFHWYSSVETHELLKVTFKLETTTNLEIDEFKKNENYKFYEHTN